MKNEVRENLKIMKSHFQFVLKNHVSSCYSGYKRLGGQSSQFEFKKHLKKLFELMLKDFTHGNALNPDGTFNDDGAGEASEKFEKYMGNCSEAGLYIRSIYSVLDVPISG